MKPMSFCFDNDCPPSNAVISADGAYRYFLSRKWGAGGKKIAFIGLNPSTADAINDDPTIRRCIGFAKSWGGTSLLMVNLFAFRATYPSELFQEANPIGPENDTWLESVVSQADLIVAAWGNGGDFLGRGEHISNVFRGRLHALAVTQKGMPSHPLYLPKNAVPKKFVPEHASDTPRHTR